MWNNTSLTSENESFGCVGCVNDVPYRDFDCERMLDLTVHADI